MIRTLISCCCAVLLFSCGNATSGSNDQESAVKFPDTIYLDVQGNEYKHLASIPDSLQTDEQKELVEKILDVIRHDVVVEENKMLLKLSKEEFLKRGIPERYYYLYQDNLRDNNRWIDSMELDNVAEMVEDMRKNLDTSRRR